MGGECWGHRPDQLFYN
jgi:hypothetical protein